ncbi:MAG TPA: murein biosynthesis integral membrane protein MurJ [Elusimicrobia bacterium]|nr:MAG: murein biosynthesis integral membrane protein MurJ [Elusimicrobia bacterium RIFOXYA12_FULL_49_49]OGS09962.1 MAG: murein biosynthesis integral membrane protein MurJ [Elusimicrobia bacterium RIFOXYA1_FULL_47_7]OGS10987.1 MAG: murein biosynthesis integral membrane protein MurJ [Elusimicrobia bacterium RIFOXYB1_FULL_48_9]OGS15177.1 MAG: murein biosynthesis integral membrane protein MurJ [Elusimicrobia bacterium RIFOXYA2_FULL_47_53]OGS26953.1 MAG: murein biosynthesis integral membrane protei
MKTQKKLTHHAGKVAAGTMVSRILGYLRDMLVAHTFGAGFAADAFYAAYRIPNLFRRLLGEGALSASFIPVLSDYLHNKSREETQKFINSLFTVLTLILLALTALGIIFAPQLVNIIAYGFTSDPDKLALTIDLTRLMFPFLFFICLAALVLGVLNTLSSFFVPAVAPASLSVAEIGFILALAPLLSPDNQIKGLAISVIIGGLGQLVIQLPKMAKLGWKFGWNPDFSHPGLKRVGTLMIPSMIGLSVDQINSFVDTVCASFLIQGSITALYYSNRVMQLPLAIFGLALASAALPAMSKYVAQNNIASVKETINYSLRLIIFILLPATAGLVVIGLPIIEVLFQRGEFSHQASLMTYSALAYYSLGLPAYAAVKILASSFYAFQDTKVPVKIAAAAMLLNAVLNILLMRPMGVGGLALASAISSWVNAGALAFLLRKKIGPLGINKIISSTLKTIIASAIMSVVSYMIAYRWLPAYPGIAMFAALAGGVASFFAAAYLLRAEEIKSIISVLKKEKPTGSD